MTDFKEVKTRDPKEAVDILFSDAVSVVPELSEKQFQRAYERMRQSWQMASLVEGTEKEVKSHILKQSKELAKIPDFNEFSIKLCLADEGYKGEEAAQLWAWGVDEAYACNLWRTKDKYHAFGVATFRFAT